MKKYVRASENYIDDIMSSESGMFTLREIHSVGIHNTPYAKLYVEGRGLAVKYVVEIRLSSANFPDFDGKPVTYVYNPNSDSCISIAHGMRGTMETLDETAEYVEVLNEALDFADKILLWLRTSDEAAQFRK